MRLNPATPATIKQVFQKTYIIPDFQRRYSWDETRCDKLFNDISEAFEKDMENPYYLGNIVAYKERDDTYIIDGQQRLTTLMLFAKALLDCAGTFSDLEKMLRVFEPISGDRSDELKIKSMVIDEDKNILKEIIIENKNPDSEHRCVKNYNYMKQMIQDWLQTHVGADLLNGFITYFLDKVLLLPIECDSMDDALIIFNTLNDRGLALTDADVFKGKIYSTISSDDDKKAFIKEWNELNKKENINSLFRDYMHLIRAKQGDTKKEKSLRDFFDKKLSNWKTIITDLRLLDVENADYSADIDELDAAYCDNLWYALSCLPNDYCQYPVKIYWYRNANLNDEGKSEFNGDVEELKRLLEKAVRYYYTFAIARPGVNYIKDKTFAVYSEIYKDGGDPAGLLDYGEYKNQFRDMITANKYSNEKCKWGLVYLMTAINKNQNQIDLRKICEIKDPEVEHILPQNGGYNGAAGWTQGQYDKSINAFGNLCLCEKAINIKASNNFFARKQAAYARSKINDIMNLSQAGKTWSYDDFVKRDMSEKKKLFDFFDIAASF